jgi:4-alpha-glucanotransferase
MSDHRPAAFARRAGLLLHPTSLPGPHGIGELGPDAYRFVDALVDAGITIWQVLPLGPTGYGDSPYQCFSAFAGNPLLIAVDGDGGGASFPAHQVDFGAVIPWKKQQLAALVARTPRDAAYEAFVRANADWLPDYALFMALKDAHGGVQWTAWEPGAALRETAALAEWRTRLAPEIDRIQLEQFLFYTQYFALKRYGADRGVLIMGDVPIYVAHDSADVWANRALFKLEPDGRPRVQAGVPPDYFSETGQLWGNPIYEWEALQRDGYQWWIRRMKAAFDLFDVVRLDHFRGFEAYWEVPGDAENAINGRWVKGPGIALFEAIHRALGPVPIVAENLGLITPEVEALRQACNYPGMSILQFAFGGDGSANDFKPHNFPRARVVYTGTHDNDTTVGWWSSGAGDSTRDNDDVAREKAYAMRYLGTDGHEMHWTLNRWVLASVADTAIIPLQDVLGTGTDTRMNLPGRPSGNWQFRFTWEQFSAALIARLGELVRTYDRLPARTR